MRRDALSTALKLALGSAAIFSSCAIYADMASSGESETFTSEDSKSIVERNVHGTLGGKNPAYSSEGGFFLTGDFLYWQAEEDDLDLTSKVSIDIVSPTRRINADSKKRLHFHWDPGFRIGAGYMFGASDALELFANWTRFHTSAHGHYSMSIPVIMSGETQFIGKWLPGFLGDIYVAKGNWRLHFNTIDLSLGRNFFLSKRLSVKPYVGLRGALIDQKYKIVYRALNVDNDILFPDTGMNAKNDFNGVGLRTGSEFQWHFSKQWNLFGSLSASIIRGRFDLKQNFNTARLNAEMTEIISGTFEYRNHFWTNRVNLEEQLGLQWETFFGRNKSRVSHLSIGAFYELGQWFQQNELSTIVFDPDPTIGGAPTGSLGEIIEENEKHGDLNFQGLTVRACLKF